MKYFNLTCNGKTLKLSKIAFGTAIFESMDNIDFYFKLLDKYYESGGNTVDCARVYSSWVAGGENMSEYVVGEWMNKRQNRRDIAVVTKCAHPPLKAMDQSRLSKTEIQSDVSESLHYLQSGKIDLLYLHRDDTRLDVAPIIDALDDVVQSGAALFIGTSNWTGERIGLANEYAKKANKTPFSISEISYSLAHTTPELCGDTTLVCMNDTEKQWYNKNIFPVMAFASQGKGFFSKYLSSDELTQKAMTRFESELNLERAKKVDVLCKKYNVSPAVIVLSFLTSQTPDVSAIIGTTKFYQLEDCLSNPDFVLSESEIEWLQEYNFGYSVK